MFLIALADVGSGFVCIEVIFLLAEADTALIKLEDVVLAVHDVGIHIELEVGRSGKFGHGFDDACLVADGINLIEVGLNRSHTIFVQLLGVHGEVVEVANLLSHRTLFVLL